MKISVRENQGTAVKNIPYGAVFHFKNEFVKGYFLRLNDRAGPDGPREGTENGV